MSAPLKIAACVVVQRIDGLWLLVSRGGDLEQWGLPGGKGEAGETAVQAAVRELQEETGLELSPDELEPVFAKPEGGRMSTAFLCRRRLPPNVVAECKYSNEGHVRWAPKEQSVQGPFAAYNEALIATLFATGRLDAEQQLGGCSAPQQLMVPDNSVASASAAVAAYLDGLACGVRRAVHSESMVLGIEPHAAEPLTNPDVGSVPATIVSVLVLEQGTTAIAHVRWTGRAGWLTLLKEGASWVVITAVSAALSPSPLRITPAAVHDVTNACWTGYCEANRACDGLAMAQIFHPVCRLTYTGADGRVVIKPQAEFCKMVAERYSSPMHAPCAHLRHDPRAAEHDTLLGASFATPEVCMVTLKVGHPPCLWTDVLTCARLDGRWWIVAKSSCVEPLLADEKR